MSDSDIRSILDGDANVSRVWTLRAMFDESFAALDDLIEMLPPEEPERDPAPSAP